MRKTTITCDLCSKLLKMGDNCHSLHLGTIVESDCCRLTAQPDDKNTSILNLSELCDSCHHSLTKAIDRVVSRALSGKEY